ncbi:MAG: hypothetical protein ACRECO_13735 [Xanthobacteraceae bacterium]
MPLHRRSRSLTPEAQENARQRYEETDEPQWSIADSVGIHRSSLERLARKQEWKRRLPRREKKPRGFTPEAVENMRRRYEDTDEPQDAIAADFGVTRGTLHRVANEHGWKKRKDRPPRDLSPAARLALEAERAIRSQIEGNEAQGPPMKTGEGQTEEGAGTGAPAPSSIGIADRLERAVEQELRSVELMQSLGGPRQSSTADAERTARTLASLTDTLYRVRRLRAPETPQAGTDDFDDIPTDIDEFRRMLARRIEAFVRSRADATVSESGSDPAPASPAA